MTLNEASAIPAPVSRARAIMEDPDLCEQDVRRLASSCMAALVATCPTRSLPDAYVQARLVLRPGSDATPQMLRVASRAILDHLARGDWNPDRPWVIEATLDPVRGSFRQTSHPRRSAVDPGGLRGRGGW